MLHCSFLLPRRFKYNPAQVKIHLYDGLYRNACPMISHELWTELHKLNRVEKLRVVQMLVNDLANDATLLFQPDVEYPVYTPYSNDAAAEILYKVLTDSEDQ